MVGRIALSMICAAFTGCVATAQHEALQKQLGETKKRLEGRIAELEKDVGTRDTRIDELAKTTGELGRTLAATNEELAEFQRAEPGQVHELQRLEKERGRIEADLAAVVTDRARLATTAGQMKKALADMSARRVAAERRVAQYRDLLKRFQALIDAKKLSVRIVRGRMVLTLPTDVLFSSGSAKLSQDGALAIHEVTAVLMSLSDRQFQVEGHTDNVPISTARFPSNWELAASRAVNVVTAMVGAGMPVDRVSAASFGEFRPAHPNDTEDGRSANRRIEIVLVPDLSGLPGFDELRAAVGG